MNEVVIKSFMQWAEFAAYYRDFISDVVHRVLVENVPLATLLRCLACYACFVALVYGLYYALVVVQYHAPRWGLRAELAACFCTDDPR